MRSDMGPCSSMVDVTNDRPCDAKLVSNYFLRDPLRIQFSDLENIFIGELAQRVTDTSAVGSMDQFISRILARRLPRKMIRSNAGFMPFAARVRRFMHRRGRGAMDKFANISADNCMSAINPNTSSALSVFAVGPRKTSVPLMLEGYFMNKTKRLAIRRSRRSDRRPRPYPLLVMTAAPAALNGCLAAIWDRAYTGISHSSRLSGSFRLERAAMFPHPTRSSFIPTLGGIV